MLSHFLSNTDSTPAVTTGTTSSDDIANDVVSSSTSSSSSSGTISKLSEMWSYLWIPFLISLSKDIVPTTTKAAAHSSSSILLPSQTDRSCSSPDQKLYYRPVIGILSHPGDGASGRLSNATNASYIAASYVKFVESAGARVIPLIYNEPIEVLYQKLNLVNGVLFTGGWAKSGLYFDVAQKIFQKVLEKNDAGDHFPLYAICLGFEILTMSISRDMKILEPFSASDAATPLNFLPNVNIEGTVFNRFPSDLLAKLQTDCLVMQNHRYGISPERFQKNRELTSFFRILTTCTDEEDKVYVSTVQGRHYPVTGFQWHPEKNAFEWGLTRIPHSEDAIQVTQHAANYLVSEARKSLNRPPTQKVLDNLIYNYSPTFCGKAGKGYDEEGNILTTHSSLSLFTLSSSMAQIETLGIIQDLQSLVSDQLQVVSYKWLSRNYLLSSNAAKRLLEEFVEKHGNELEVVYALSGWLKSNPQIYHIKLVSGPKLAEAKQEFDGTCSVQVYSVQACIPKDAAVLWNAEFVQAEELFKQPSTVDNCLRDNRFCAISSDFIKRNVDGTPSIVSTPKPQSGGGLNPSKSDLARQNGAARQSVQEKTEQRGSKVGIPSPNVVKEVKSETTGTGVHDLANKPTISKDKDPHVPANKKKAQNSKSSSGTDGSLANFWSRASAKSKPSCPSETTNGACADAQISAREAVAVEGVNSDDDDDGQDMKFKRASNGEATRKRRMIMDFSDDEFEDAVNLASPDTGKSSRDLKESIETLFPEKSKLDLDKCVEDKLEVKKNVTINEQSIPLLKEDSSTVPTDRTKGTSPKEDKNVNKKDKLTNTSVPENGVNKRDKVTHSSVQENGVNKNDKPSKATPDSPKRRKVLKTRIDDRGREVTEVIWEGEDTAAAATAEKAKNDQAEKAGSGTVKKAENNSVPSRPPAVAKKSPAVGGNTAPSNQTGKGANKKTGIKDPKQGNILSFFKKKA
ncbi:hypothetical protein F8388_000509 [Cannabis sativa]|uniref:folate gamma-glutamyl hydrolase n=2 Tax=Cannabis sativa TaxID=3483 RepID=A0A7J6EZH2_CANSA|nr:hypothetical protein F8388_000509 [Cannabis sativa]